MDDRPVDTLADGERNDLVVSLLAGLVASRRRVERLAEAPARGAVRGPEEPLWVLLGIVAAARTAERWLGARPPPRASVRVEDAEPGDLMR